MNKDQKNSRRKEGGKIIQPYSENKLINLGVMKYINGTFQYSVGTLRYTQEEKK